MIEAPCSGQTLQVDGPRGTLAATALQPENPSLVSGEALLFLHPTNLTSRCWSTLAASLKDERRVLMDSRGHGASHQNGRFWVRDYAEDVLAVMDSLRLDHVHLIGGSLGGSIACAVAASSPHRIRSITAIGAALEPADAAVIAQLVELLEREDVSMAFDIFLGREMSRGLDPLIAEDARRQLGLRHRSAALIKEITLNAFSEDARPYAGGVQCPAYVVTGSFDESCPVAAGGRMAEALNARFEVLPGLGHLAMMQAPQLISGKLAAFLAAVRGR